MAADVGSAENESAAAAPNAGLRKLRCKVHDQRIPALPQLIKNSCRSTDPCYICGWRVDTEAELRGVEFRNQFSTNVCYIAVTWKVPIFTNFHTRLVIVWNCEGRVDRAMTQR